MRGYQLVLVVGSCPNMDSLCLYCGYLDYPRNLGNNLRYQIVGKYERCNLLPWACGGLYHGLYSGYELVRLTGFDIGHFNFLPTDVHYAHSYHTW